VVSARYTLGAFAFFGFFYANLLTTDAETAWHLWNVPKPTQGEVDSCVSPPPSKIFPRSLSHLFLIAAPPR
jgi:hypothetical protein